jgi:DnaJ family protein C protein 3
MRLPRLGLGLLFLGGVYADQGGLYPPGLLPLINRANALLSAGQFNEAAKIYSEAIGTLQLNVNSVTKLFFMQTRLRRTTSCTTNAPPLISRYNDTQQPWMISTRSYH